MMPRFDDTIYAVEKQTRRCTNTNKEGGGKFSVIFACYDTHGVRVGEWREMAF
jgi:hypothetical protein